MNERPVEWRFLFDQLSKITPESVLDVGSGNTAVPHMLRNCGFVVTAADNIKDYWKEDVFNRHYYILNDDITRTKIENTFDVVCCISVLEHIAACDEAVRNMSLLLRPAGHLLLTFPYNDTIYCRNVYDLPGAGYGKGFPFICQVFSRADLDRWSAEYGLTLVCQEYWQIFTGDLWTFGTRLYPPREVTRAERHHLTCVALRKL
jgi:SAM-dependent methyltransferase